jgi:hypothetical protein
MLLIVLPCCVVAFHMQAIPAEELLSRRQQGARNIVAAGVEILRERIACLSELLQQGLVTVQVRFLYAST